MNSAQDTTSIFANRQLVVFLDGRKVVYGLEYTDRKAPIEIFHEYQNRRREISLPRVGVINLNKPTLHSVAAVLSLVGDSDPLRLTFIHWLGDLVAKLIEKTANRGGLWQIEPGSLGDLHELCGEHRPGWALAFLIYNDLRTPINEILGATWRLLRDTGYFNKEVVT